MPFHYRVVSVRGDDGVRMRFPTHAEQPGDGRGYFAFGAYAVLRARFLSVPVGCAWCVDVPARAELGARGFYHENRFLFSVGRENVSNTVGVRFIDERRVGVFLGADPEPIEQLDLARDCRGSRLHLAVALGAQPGRLVVHVDESGLIVDVDPLHLRGPAVNAIVWRARATASPKPPGVSSGNRRVTTTTTPSSSRSRTSPPSRPDARRTPCYPSRGGLPCSSTSPSTKAWPRSP